MNPLWQKFIVADKDYKNTIRAWEIFRGKLMELTPEGFTHNDLLQAILNITEYPEASFLEPPELVKWAAKLENLSQQDRLVSWLRSHLPPTD